MTVTSPGLLLSPLVGFLHSGLRERLRDIPSARSLSPPAPFFKIFLGSGDVGFGLPKLKPLLPPEAGLTDRDIDLPRLGFWTETRFFVGFLGSVLFILKWCIR